MTRASLLTSILVFVVLAAAGGDVCRGDPPVMSAPGTSQVPPTDCKPVHYPRVAGYWNSGCLADGNGDPYWPCGEDEIGLTVAPNTLYVVHENAAYNCCPDDIVISLSAEGDVLRLTEEEILTDPCYCICCYEVTATIVDLAPGPYTVEFWWYDYDTHDYRCYVEEIVIPGGGPQPDPDKPPVTDDAGDFRSALASFKPFSPPQVADYWHSDCLETSLDPDWWPCEGDDEIILTVEGNTLHVLHTNATYNCCPDDIVISLEVEGDLLRLTEEEILTQGCWCICCYEVGATVVDLAPDTYLVVFCWFDYQTDEERCYEEEIVIP
jgi:hypothetical protein